MRSAQIIDAHLTSFSKSKGKLLGFELFKAEPNDAYSPDYLINFA